jgi:hypothetical protein
LRPHGTNAPQSTRGTVFRADIYDLWKVDEFKRMGASVGDWLHLELESLRPCLDNAKKVELDKAVLAGPLAFNGRIARIGKGKHDSVHHISCEFLGMASTSKGQKHAYVVENASGSPMNYRLSMDLGVRNRLMSERLEFGSKLIVRAINIGPPMAGGKMEGRMMSGHIFDYYILNDNFPDASDVLGSDYYFELPETEEEEELPIGFPAPLNMVSMSDGTILFC